LQAETASQQNGPSQNGTKLAKTEPSFGENGTMPWPKRHHALAKTALNRLAKTAPRYSENGTLPIMVYFVLFSHIVLFLYNSINIYCIVINFMFQSVLVFIRYLYSKPIHVHFNVFK
jgi:hypothetical protein